MPGDTYSDTLHLVNDGDKDIKIYFRSSAADDSELLDKIQLKLTTEINGKTTVFYNGDLRAEELNEDVVLGVIPKDQEGDFHFEIYVPHELNNKYTISSSFVQWIFSTEEIQEPARGDNPKTGDTSHITFWINLTGLSLSGIGLILLLRKKEMNGQKEEEYHG